MGAQPPREKQYPSVKLTDSGGSTVSTVPKELREDYSDHPNVPTDLGEKVRWVVRETGGEPEVVIEPDND